jgi:hypothetical protein
MKVDVSAAATALTTNANHVFQVVGLPGKVTNVAAASNLKVYLKMLSSSKLEPYLWTRKSGGLTNGYYSATA